MEEVHELRNELIGDLLRPEDDEGPIFSFKSELLIRLEVDQNVDPF